MIGPVYSATDIEEARRAAFREGRDAGRTAARAEAEATGDVALKTIADLMGSTATDAREIARDTAESAVRFCLDALLSMHPSLAAQCAVADIEAMLKSGADKVSLNTAAIKNPQLIADADNASRIGDDSPVRVIVAFDGDKSKLDFEDQSLAKTVKLFSGREMPYATIQYIWENKLPPETVLDNARTSRSKMLVVESGPAQLDKWLYFKRNVKADYERLFGEPPGPIIFVGVMTDSNATQSQATAYYGDIRLSQTE